MSELSGLHTTCLNFFDLFAVYSSQLVGSFLHEQFFIALNLKLVDNLKLATFCHLKNSGYILCFRSDIIKHAICFTTGQEFFCSACCSLFIICKSHYTFSFPSNRANQCQSNFSSSLNVIQGVIILQSTAIIIII